MSIPRRVCPSFAAGHDKRMSKEEVVSFSIISLLYIKGGGFSMIIYLQTIADPGDKSKFEHVYLTYRAYMFYIANGILQNAQDAEDAVHNAFLSIAKNIEKIGDPASLKTKGYISFPLPEEHGLDWCISKLPPRYRQVILLKYSHGYSTKEIAEILCISSAAASKLDQRAKKRLYELCQKEGIL